MLRNRYYCYVTQLTIALSTVFCVGSTAAGEFKKETIIAQQVEQQIKQLALKGQRVEALATIAPLVEKSRQAHDTVSLAKWLWIKGQVEYQTGKNSDALELYRQATALDPQSPRYFESLVDALGEDNQFEQAYVLASSCARKWPEEVAFLIASDAPRVRFKQASEALRKQLSTHPEDDAARHKLIECLKYLGDWQAAQHICGGTAKVRSARLLMDELAFVRSNSAILRNDHRLDLEAVHLTERLSLLVKQAGDRALFREYVSVLRAAKIEPLGEMYADKYAKRYEPLHAVSNECNALHEIKSERYSRQHQYREAAREMQIAITKYGSSVRKLVRMAQLQELATDYATAAETAKEVLRKNNQNPRALLILARCLSKTARPAEAVDCILKAERIDPQCPEIFTSVLMARLEFAKAGSGSEQIFTGLASVAKRTCPADGYAIVLFSVNFPSKTLADAPAFKEVTATHLTLQSELKRCSSPTMQVWSEEAFRCMARRLIFEKRYQEALCILQKTRSADSELIEVCKTSLISDNKLLSKRIAELSKVQDTSPYFWSALAILAETHGMLDTSIRCWHKALLRSDSDVFITPIDAVKILQHDLAHGDTSFVDGIANSVGSCCDSTTTTELLKSQLGKLVAERQSSVLIARYFSHIISYCREKEEAIATQTFIPVLPSKDSLYIIEIAIAHAPENLRLREIRSALCLVTGNPAGAQAEIDIIRQKNGRYRLSDAQAAADRYSGQLDTSEAKILSRLKSMSGGL